MKLAEAIDDADNRWQHGPGDSGANWEEFLAYHVLRWFRDQGIITVEQWLELEKEVK